MSLAKASRTLLFPGSLPPLSHFGVTLLRHVVITGLRFTYHQLGLPLPEQPPVRIFRLRLYLDTNALAYLLQDRPVGEEVLGALIDPGGRSHGGPLLSKLRGAAWFHQVRLRLRRFPADSLKASAPTAGGPEQTWGTAKRALSKLLPTLCDAFLAEVIASMSRRRTRQRGHPVSPCLSREAHKWMTGKSPQLAFLGSPDPLVPSWETAGGQPKRIEEAGSRIQEIPPFHPLRGRFREHYRAVLNIFQVHYEAFAEGAVERDILQQCSDAYFLPFDLAGDLAADSRPPWLDDAIATNRREYEALQAAPSPPDQLFGGAEELTGLSVQNDWDAAPLHGMP